MILQKHILHGSCRQRADAELVFDLDASSCPSRSDRFGVKVGVSILSKDCFRKKQFARLSRTSLFFSQYTASYNHSYHMSSSVSSVTIRGTNMWVNQGNVSYLGNMLMKHQIGGLGSSLTFADVLGRRCSGACTMRGRSDLYTRERRHRSRK
jgi:hypothetical protein